ncbi:MAG: EI24 domain-containing protein [Pseudomonadota bacterium]
MFPLKKTIVSIAKANLFGLMMICAFLAIIVVLFIVATVTFVTSHLINIEKGWLDTIVSWIIGIVTGIGGWFMLPALIVLISGFFQGKVITRVELIYYPCSVRKKEPNVWPDIGHDIKFTMWAIFLNLLILPLYLFGIGFFVSIALNSYLVGREVFECVAGHHMGKPQAKKLGRKNSKTVYLSGLLITLTTLIPVLNLFIPIIATVWMVHVYHFMANDKPLA